MGFKPLTDAVTAKEFLRRPEVSYQDVVAFIGPAAEDLDDKIIELIETEIKYEGYISKTMDQVAKMKRMEEKRIPANIDWDDIDSIATEARQKFKLINPETIGQASRISGVNPADISILMVYLEGKNRSILKLFKNQNDTSSASYEWVQSLALIHLQPPIVPRTMGANSSYASA